MGRFICKFEDGPAVYYLEWSTVAAAPVTFGLPLEEFKEYYRDEYGEEGMRDLEDLLKRVQEKGCSSYPYRNVDEVISGNRAGKEESCLTKEEIIDWYCRRKENP